MKIIPREPVPPKSVHDLFGIERIAVVQCITNYPNSMSSGFIVTVINEVAKLCNSSGAYKRL